MPMVGREGPPPCTSFGGPEYEVDYLPPHYISDMVVARAKQHVHLFLGSKGLGIQQGTSVWVDLPKSMVVKTPCFRTWPKCPLHWSSSLIRGRIPYQ